MIFSFKLSILIYLIVCILFHFLIQYSYAIVLNLQLKLSIIIIIIYIPVIHLLRFHRFRQHYLILLCKICLDCINIVYDLFLECLTYHNPIKIAM